MAVIGAGGRGKDHIGAFARRSDVEIAAIVDVDESIRLFGCEYLERGRHDDCRGGISFLLK